MKARLQVAEAVTHTAKLRCSCFQMTPVLRSYVSTCWDQVDLLKLHKRGLQTSLDTLTWQGEAAGWISTVPCQLERKRVPDEKDKSLVC